MGRFWVNVAILFLGGALAASSFILAKKPNAKDMFAKVAPYQGTIGVIMFLWGIWDVIWLVMNLDMFKLFFAIPMVTFKITAIMLPVTAVVELILGFLLGFGMIQAFAAKKNPAAAQKSEAAMKKLAPHQTWLGFVSMACAIWWILFVVVFFKVG
jgi:K+-sensing histidine kinase KdpD